MYSCNTEPGFLQCAPRPLGDIPVGLRLKKTQQRTAHQDPCQSNLPQYRQSNRQLLAAKSCATPSPFHFMGEVSHCFSSTWNTCALNSSVPFPTGDGSRCTLGSCHGPNAPHCSAAAPGTAAPLSGTGQHSSVTLLPLSYTAWQSLAAIFAIALVLYLIFRNCSEPDERRDENHQLFFSSLNRIFQVVTAQFTIQQLKAKPMPMLCLHRQIYAKAQGTRSCSHRKEFNRTEPGTKLPRLHSSASAVNNSSVVSL